MAFNLNYNEQEKKVQHFKVEYHFQDQQLWDILKLEHPLLLMSIFHLSSLACDKYFLSIIQSHVSSMYTFGELSCKFPNTLKMHVDAQATYTPLTQL